VDPRRDAVAAGAVAAADETPPAASLLALFADRAAALGVVVGGAAESAAAADWLAELAMSWQIERAVAAGELIAAAPGFVAALGDRGLVPAPAGEPAATRDAPLGLSLGRLAVAETGSVLLAEPSLADRAVGMLSLAQVVVCPSGELVPSLDEAAPALRAVAARPGGGFATLVTGPSRTADIERVLTVGVQGPARLAVLFVDALA